MLKTEAFNWLSIFEESIVIQWDKKAQKIDLI